MKRIIWNKIGFQQGIYHLQGKEIVERPYDLHDQKFEKCESPRGSVHNDHMTFFDDNTVMACVSDWDSGYYGDIDAADPLFFLGRVIEISKEEIEQEMKKEIENRKRREKRRS